MKTIEQEKSDYLTRLMCEFATEVPNLTELAEESFLLGVNFAQQWISVDDELPEENYVRCLVDNGNEEYMIAVFTGDGWSYPSQHIFYEGIFKVKFWRPIEKI